MRIAHCPGGMSSGRDQLRRIASDSACRYCALRLLSGPSLPGGGLAFESDGADEFAARAFASCCSFCSAVGDLFLPHALHFGEAALALGFLLALALGQVDLFLPAARFLFAVDRRFHRNRLCARGLLLDRVRFGDRFLRRGLRRFRHVFRQGLRHRLRRRCGFLRFRRRGRRLRRVGPFAQRAAHRRGQCVRIDEFGFDHRPGGIHRCGAARPEHPEEDEQEEQRVQGQRREEGLHRIGAGLPHCFVPPGWLIRPARGTWACVCSAVRTS